MNGRLSLTVLACLLGVVGSTSRAATLEQSDLDRGVVPKAGDEIILRDFSRLTPKTAMSIESQPGKWWLRPYKQQDGQQHIMLMTVERDMENPESCIVPTVTYPMNLHGWYEIWIGTYRDSASGAAGGGVDVRVNGDDCFVHIDPKEVALHAKRPAPREGILVEMNYKPAVDLAGQNLLIRQPFGTYESWHWGRCDAALAYVRLVKLSDKEVAAFQADQARTDRRMIAYDDDNFSRYWMWGGESKEKILRIFEPFRYHDIEFFSLCLGTPGQLKVPSPFNKISQNRMGRLGDKRMKTVYQDFVDNDINLLNVAAERAHKYGMKLLPGWRMSSSDGAAAQEHLAKCYLKTTRRLDYAYPQVREYFVNTVRNVLQNYNVDGFILNFTRHCVHFNPDEPNKEKHMNSLSAEMRKMVDEVSSKKGQKLLLAATFSESPYVSGFLNHNLKINAGPEERLKYQGINVADWVNSGYYDMIMPEGHNIDKYIKMTRGTSTKCYPRWEVHSTIDGPPVGANVHDPTPAEDKQDRKMNPRCGPRDFEEGWVKLHDKGADGLYMFNNPMGWTSLRRMGHIDETRRRVKAGEVFGIVEGQQVEFIQR